MLKKALSAVLVSSLIIPGLCFADNFKIATIEVNRVINSLKESKQKKAELDKIGEAKKQVIAKKKANLDALEQKYKAAGSDPDSKEGMALRSAIKDYERAVNDTKEDFNREFLKVNRELTEKAFKHIEAYAKRNRINLILEKGFPGAGPVLYGDDAADITAAVIAELK